MVIRFVIVWKSAARKRVWICLWRIRLKVVWTLMILVRVHHLLIVELVLERSVCRVIMVTRIHGHFLLNNSLLMRCHVP